MTYVSRFPPWDHQKQALQKMQGKEAFALLMAMRTGKTKTLLDDWASLEHAGQCHDLLVIAPGGVYKTWDKAVREHLSHTLLNRVKLFIWTSGMGSVKERELKEFLTNKEGDTRIFLVNVEALSLATTGARVACETFLKASDKQMLVIDESTVIKSPKAKRTKYINQKLSPLAKYRRILSGLPTPKSPLDLYCQFEFLDGRILGHKSYYTFRRRYAITVRRSLGGHSFDLVTGYRDVDQLNQIILPHSHRVLLEDCYDLPEKMYTTREVPLTEEQKRVYKEIKTFATSELSAGSHVTATQVITQILRMHQVLCGHVNTEDGRFVELDERRTDTLLDLLKEYDGKAIIWCSYDADVRKVAKALEKFAIKESRDEDDKSPIYIDEGNLKHVARFWGGNRNNRELEEHRFLNDPQCRFIVATAAAGGRGRTWTVADMVVYYSNTADLEHRSQSEERAQGVDKKNSVLYVDLVAPGTVDEKMLNILRKKIDMAAAVTSDGWKEWVV